MPSSRSRITAICLLTLVACLPSFHQAAAQCPQWIPGPLSPDDQGANGPVYAMTSWDPDGGGPQAAVLVVGGSFSSVDGVAASNLAMWDGLVWRPIGGGTNAPVRALTVYNGWLVVGGEFFSVGGLNIPRLAAWTGTGWLAFGPGIDPTGTVSVDALTVYQGALVAGGTFQTPFKHIARWNGAAWDAMGEEFYGPIRDFAQMNGELYAGGNPFLLGSLGFVDGVVRYNGAYWSELGHPTLAGGSTDVTAIGAHQGSIWADGNLGLQRYTGGDTWQPVNGGPCDVQSFLVSGGLLYAAGYCCPDQPSSLKRIQVWNGFGWFQVGTGIGADCPGASSESAVHVLGEYNGLLHAGGSFNLAGNAAANNIAFWNGAIWNVPSAPMNLSALGVFGNKVGIGGYYSHPTPTGHAYHIASWDGTSLATLGSGTDAPVLALYGYTDSSFPNDRHLVAGGSFTRAGGLGANRIAKWTESSLGPGGGWAPMGNGFSGPVYAIEPYVGDIVAGGAFLSSGATATNRVGRWNGSAWQSMGTGMNGTVRALKSYFVSIRKNDIIVAGGDFTTANGATANRIAYWTQSVLDGTIPWQPMGLGFNGTVHAIERYNGATYAAGSFTASGSTTLNYIARYTASGWIPVGPVTFGGGMNGPVLALEVIGGYLYAAGNFSAADGVPAYRVARWDGTAWSGVDGGTTGLVQALAGYGTEVLAAGVFDQAGAFPTTSLARFTPTGAPWFLQQPISQIVAQGANASFEVEPAPGYGALSYRWRRDGLPLTDGPTPNGSVISGAASPALLLTSVALADSGTYDCVASSACGAATSSQAMLSVQSTVGVEDVGAGFAFSLSVHPNPARRFARIGFVLPRAGRARVEVFDLRGRRVATLLDGERAAGPHDLAWTGDAISVGRSAAGVYFARLTSADGTLTRRITWLP